MFNKFCNRKKNAILFYVMIFSHSHARKCVSFFRMNFNQVFFPCLIHHFINTKTMRSHIHTTTAHRVTHNTTTKESMLYIYFLNQIFLLGNETKWKPQQKWINYYNGWGKKKTQSDTLETILWGVSDETTVTMK